MYEKKPKILVVDDEQVTTDLAKRFLEKHGFNVVCAYDGETALVLAHSEKPDLILLDVMLPKLDGFEVCQQLKNIFFSPCLVRLFTFYNQ